MLPTLMAAFGNDPEIGVDWGVENPILSAKDEKNSLLKELGIVF